MISFSLICIHLSAQAAEMLAKEDINAEVISSDRALPLPFLQHGVLPELLDLKSSC